MSLMLDEHRHYLADRARVDAYARAIAEVVHPGVVVLDLGCGTGILGLLACRAGASRVYAVEETELIEIARQVARANGFADRIVHFHAHSSHVTLPELVDVVVCDQGGRFGVDGTLLQDVEDARRRLLAPGGRTIPASIQVALAPVESPDAFSAVEFWRGRPAGFDFSVARGIAANTGYPRMFSAGELLAGPATSESIDLSAPPPPVVRVDGSWRVTRPGTLHGLAAWFAATLAPGVVLTNSPLVSDRVNRRQAFFPIAEPVAVEGGDEVRAAWRVRVDELMASWTVDVQGARGAAPRARFAHSTLEGMLLDRGALEKTRPAHVPRLSARGRARRAVLELVDGGRSVAEIERAVLVRHAELFPSPHDATVFVAEVLARDTE